jgi:hypothetical protein
LIDLPLLRIGGTYRKLHDRAGLEVPPGRRALIWDFRPGVRPHPFGPRHAQLPDPFERVQGGPLRVVGVTPWRWPWRFNLIRRIELVRADGAPGHAGTSRSGEMLHEPG